MNSISAEASGLSSGDFGLLSPQWAGAPVAAASSDAAVLAAMLEVEVALVRAWIALGHAPEGADASVQRAIDAAPIDVVALAADARGGGNPVIPLVRQLRAAVVAVDPDAAVWVHRGATSQDVLDTAIMLVARRALDAISTGLASTCAATARLADAHRSTLMASRTLTQHGVPTTFGLKASGWLAGVDRAAERLDEARGRLAVQWGGAGGTLASFAVIGQAGTGLEIGSLMADSLDLADSVPWQTQRSSVVELGTALAQVATALGKVAVDVLALARPEIGELAEPQASGRGGSSAMPQKQNPVLSVLIHSSAQRAPGLAAELLRSAVAVDERPDGAWHSEWSALRELLRLVGGAAELAAELTEGLHVDGDAMLQNLDLSGPLVVSERLMLQLGPIVGRDRLQQLVSAVVQDPGASLEGLLRAEPTLADIGDAELSAMLDPAQYLGDSELIIDSILAAHAARTAAEGAAS